MLCDLKHIVGCGARAEAETTGAMPKDVPAGGTSGETTMEEYGSLPGGRSWGDRQWE